jgi:vacuolar-type H+-ATPase subunit E/Vma4
MGLEELVARLQRDADARVVAIRARAAEEIATLEAQATGAASRLHDGTLAARRGARSAELERETATRRRHAREARLVAENAVLERVLARTVELFEEAARDPASLAALVHATEGALRYVDGPAVVRARPAIAEALRGSSLARERGAALRIEGDPAMPVGVVVTGLDGAVVVDETFVARLDRLRPRLAIELLREAAP